MNLDSLISKWKLDTHSTAIKHSSKEAIALTSTASPVPAPIGTSKLGGNPDLPSTIAWPYYEGKPLEFIGQINLSEINSVALTDEILPDTGLLSFFASADAWGYDPKHREGFKVFHFPADPGTITRKDPPPLEDRKILFGLIKTKQKNKINKECLLTPSKMLTIPYEPEPLGIPEELMDNYFELMDELGGRTRLLGHAEPIQNEMETECQLVTHGLYCGDSSGYAKPEAKELEKSAHQWELLLQVDTSDDLTDMQWGDAGRLYFWIREQDLKAQKFDQCWFICQCY